MIRALLALVWLGLCLASEKDRPTPPPVFPPETERPKDYNNCRINANTIFPWIVAIFDRDSNSIVGHGSMLTYIAFITTCRQYKKPPEKYQVHGQFLWNLTRPLDPCKQDRDIEKIIKHPRCLESPQMATFFDFTIFRMKLAFAITGPNYPTMAFRNSPIDMLSEIQYINAYPNTTGCILPSFLEQKEAIPTFDWDSFVESIPFHSKCVKLLCEKVPADATFSTMCEKRFGERANGTQLCMRYKNTTKPFKVDSARLYWSAGTPLVCNSTTYGIAAQAKLRSDFSFHYVITLLRVWEWLLSMLTEHGAPWGLPGQIEDKDIHMRHYDEPKRTSILDGGKPPNPPLPESRAVVSTSSLSITFFTLFLCFSNINTLLI